MCVHMCVHVCVDDCTWQTLHLSNTYGLPLFYVIELLIISCNSQHLKDPIKILASYISVLPVGCGSRTLTRNQLLLFQ